MGIIQDLQKEKDTIGVLTMTDWAREHLLGANKAPFDRSKKSSRECEGLSSFRTRLRCSEKPGSRSRETLVEAAALEVPRLNVNLPNREGHRFLLPVDRKAHALVDSLTTEVAPELYR